MLQIRRKKFKYKEDKERARNKEALSNLILSYPNQRYPFLTLALSYLILEGISYTFKHITQILEA